MSATVLLIAAQKDDHARVGQALAGIRGAPFRLETAGTLADGLARLKLGRIDAVLLDLNLPDSLGLTTFLRVQPKAPQIPVVVITDPTDDDLGRNAVDRGALDYLVQGPGHDAAARQGAALRDGAHAHAEGPQGLGAALPRAVPERDGRGLPDHARRQVHGRQSGAGADARLRLRGRAARGRRGTGHLYGPRPSRGLGGGDGAGRGSPQCRAGAQAQGRQQDRSAGELARRAGFRRPGDFLRGHAHRHHGCARAFAAAVLRRQPRRAHRAREPSRVRVAAAARDRDDAGNRRDARGVLPRPRPLQGRQRHLRARRRRRAAAAAGPRAAGQGAFRGCRGAPRRRRVRAAAAQLRPEPMRCRWRTTC